MIIPEPIQRVIQGRFNISIHKGIPQAIPYADHHVIQWAIHGSLVRGDSLGDSIGRSSAIDSHDQSAGYSKTLHYLMDPLLYLAFE